MVLRACRECGNEVSTEAATCPKCGTPNPGHPKGRLPQTKAAKVKGYGCLSIIVSMAVILFLAYRTDEDWNAAHPGMIKGANGEPVPESSRLDFAKQLYVKAFSPVCVDADEVEAWYQQKPSKCIAVPFDTPVVEMEGSGFLFRTHRVRTTGRDPGNVGEGWVSERALRN